MATPSPTPCPYIGPAAQYCQTSTGGGNVNTNPGGIGASLDPVASLAKQLAKAAAWTVQHLGGTLDHGAATVGFGNTAFITQYAIAFGAATFLTLLLWVIAVFKRVVQGARIQTAFGEAIGFLWMTVMASAFTPLLLQVVVSSVDAITKGLAGGSNAGLFDAMATSLQQGAQGGGPVMLALVSLATIVFSGVLWLELALRSVALLAGALLGPVVYSGLVDRRLWKHVRRWAGFMGALVLMKPMLVLAISVSKALTDQSSNVMLTGIAVILIALSAGLAVFRFIPGYGDDIQAGLAARAVMGGGRVGLKAAGSATGWIAGGIATHGDRAPAQRSGEDGGGRREKSTGSVSEGIQTHGNRNRGASGGGGSAPQDGSPA